MRRQFSHLHGHKFKHGFGDTIDHMCAHQAEFETTEHFLFCFNLYYVRRLKLFDETEKVYSHFLTF